MTARHPLRALRPWRHTRSLLVFVVVALIMAMTGAFATASATSRKARAAPQGELVMAAEQELDTADWIDASAGSSWGNWTLGIHTLPQAFMVTAKGEYKPSPTLAGAPTLDPGPPMKVTYKINKDAVWSDGQPIVSKDFAYLWKQITTGKNIYDTTGYDQIQSVDTTDPKTAVVTFSERFAAWRDLFGGFYFLLPSHLLEGKDRNAEMKDGYAFSGGPWMLENGKAGWKKGVSITLVPNPRFWGKHPRIARVTFQFITDSAAEIAAITSGQVSAGYPQPQIGILDQFDREPNLKSIVKFGNQYEGLWLNTATPPLNSKNVRQALAYATDRAAIVSNLLVPSIRQGKVLQSFNVPTFKDFFSPAFAKYKPNMKKVTELMEADGWKKNSSGIWEKNGTPANLEISTTAGNRGREQVELLLQSQWRTAGFNLTINNTQSGVLFGTWGPKGVFTIGMYAQVGTPDPGLCIIFCSKNIPSAANGFVGQNWTRLASPALDKPWLAADTELDVAKRATIVKQAEAVLADEVPAIPLYQKPTVFVFDKRKIAGPLSNNTTNGPFFNMHLWRLKARA
jgi:peptide/nickel transport system substrate-binding protein